MNEISHSSHSLILHDYNFHVVLQRTVAEKSICDIAKFKL